MSPNKKTAGTSGEDITNGIDIMPWTVKTNNDIEVTYNTWDFAGQTLYYNTHQVCSFLNCLILVQHTATLFLF